jgi:broad specificity phosphatase PhoE
MRDRFVRRRSPSFWAPHGETYQEGLARIAWVQETLLSRHGGRPETILVVGHEYAGGRLIEMLLDMEPLGRFDLANAGLSCVGQRLDGSLVARFVNRM